MVKDCKPFQLDIDELYICCHRPFRLPNGKYSGMIRVYELQTPQKSPNMLTNMDWCFTPELIDPDTTTGYNSLMINGHPMDYNKLVQDLCISRLRVNRRGHCYFQLNEGITTETYGITFYRMNDLWKWSDYGVKVDLLLTDKPQMNWDRLYILDGSKPTEVSNNQDVVIKSQLEEAKIQLKEKNDEVITLKSQIYKKDVENQTLNGQVKKLQLELEEAKRSHPQSSTSLTIVAVPRTVFKVNWISIMGNHNVYSIYWTKKPISRTFTPTHEVVNTTFRVPLTFRLITGMSFDANNWVYMRVKEMSTPALIYEGHMFSLNIHGHVVSSPIDSSTNINWGSGVVRGQEHFDFAPVLLVGHGVKIAIFPYPM